MPLFVIATPIGNPRDFSERARQTLLEADLVIGEELKPLRQILKAAGVQARAVDQLNEHSDAKDVAHLLERCREGNVALVSDCGTPGFCDPGAELVDACHRAGVKVSAIPGPSSLMALLSICGHRLDEFTFVGFLPAKRELREARWRALLKEKRAVLFLETPYRLARLAEDLGRFAATRACVIGLDLTGEHEKLLRGTGAELARQLPSGDAEPVCLLLPQN